MNHSLRRLEEKLGLCLLNRSTRGIAPMEAGGRLLETLGPALAEINASIASLTALCEQPVGIIRISTPEHAARPLLWPIVDRLIADYPDIHGEINVDIGLTDLVARRYDAGIRLGERLEQGMMRSGSGVVCGSTGAWQSGNGAASHKARRQVETDIQNFPALANERRVWSYAAVILRRAPETDPEAERARTSGLKRSRFA